MNPCDPTRQRIEAARAARRAQMERAQPVIVPLPDPEAPDRVEGEGPGFIGQGDE